MLALFSMPDWILFRVQTLLTATVPNPLAREIYVCTASADCDSEYLDKVRLCI